LPDIAENLQKLRALNRRQWSVLLQSGYVIPLSYLHLRIGGFRKALTWARTAAARRSDLSREKELELARETAFAFAVACKFGPWKPKCLVRSLALGRFLYRRGIPFDIRIGVPNTREMPPADGAVDFTAHAWVETHGAVLNDRPDIAGTYLPFDQETGRGSGFIRDDRGYDGNRGNRG
jgi:hypothetical protein